MHIQVALVYLNKSAAKNMLNFCVHMRACITFSIGV